MHWFKTSRIAAVLIINMATLSWAGNMVLGRWLRDYIHPFSLSAIRYTIACAIFLSLLPRQSPLDRSPRGDGKVLVAMALCGVAVFPCLLYIGLRYTTAINATILNTCGPLMAMILAAVLYREPIIIRQLIGVIIGFLGVAVLISRGRLEVLWSLAFNAGDLIVLAAVVSWAFYTLLRKKASPERSTISISAYSVFFGLPVLWLIAIPEITTHPPVFTPRSILAICFIGVFPSFVSLIAWNHGVNILGPKATMTYINTVPVYGLLLSALLLGESVTWPQIVGVILVIAGSLWTTISEKNG